MPKEAACEDQLGKEIEKHAVEELQQSVELPKIVVGVEVGHLLRQLVTLHLLRERKKLNLDRDDVAAGLEPWLPVGPRRSRAVNSRREATSVAPPRPATGLAAAFGLSL